MKKRYPELGDDITIEYPSYIEEKQIILDPSLRSAYEEPKQRWHCNSCNTTWVSRRNFVHCPFCGSARIRVI